MTQDVSMLRAWLEAHQHEMVEDLRGCLRIASKKEPPAGPGAPFGGPIREALAYTLGVAARLGFTVADVDGYAGHAEMGAGPEMVAAMAHLDVVPEGEGWDLDPYGADIRDGFIYARGSQDNKGPAFAALYAAAALRASGLPLRRRVRIIFGCDEESGFGCLTHYFGAAAQERPVYAFTPDAGYPLCYAEMGICNLTLTRAVPQADARLRVAEAGGGTRGNVVPDAAWARLAGEPADLYAALVALQGNWDRNVWAEARADCLLVRARGKSAHGSRPADGDNAIARLARALKPLDLPRDAEWLDWAARSADPTGATLGIAGADDVAGPLTCNLGVLQFDGTGARLVYNIRYPVTWRFDDLQARFESVLAAAGWNLAAHTDSPPLHVPLDQEPSMTLLRVYREETGDTVTQPFTMGGGTYARATPRAVAFGAAFPGGADGPPHEPNERIAIDTLVRSAGIMARALYELAR